MSSSFKSIGDVLDVTPHDTNPILNSNDRDQVTRAISCASDGDIAVITEKGQSVTLYRLAGMWHPDGVTHILSTGTTATGIQAGF
jgi:hypothetical protein